MIIQATWDDEVEVTDAKLIELIEADIARTKALLSRMSEENEEELVF